MVSTRNPLLFLDSQGRVIFAIGGQPADVAKWMENHDLMVEEYEYAEKHGKFPASGPNRRGTKAWNTGVSVGGGQPVRRPIDILRNLLSFYRHLPTSPWGLTKFSSKGCATTKRSSAPRGSWIVS